MVNDKCPKCGSPPGPLDEGSSWACGTYLGVGMFPEESVDCVKRQLGKSQSDNARLRSKDFEWLRAARKLNDAKTDDEHRAAMACLDALRLGYADVDTPPTILEQLRAENAKLRSELEQLNKMLREADEHCIELQERIDNGS